MNILWKLIRKKSQLQEKRISKEFNGQLQPASGALPFAKGDIRTGGRETTFNESDLLIEAKYTDKSFYIFKKSIWDKIEKEAFKDNFRTPMMQIDIRDLHLVVMPHYHYVEHILKNIVGFEQVNKITSNSFKINKLDVSSRIVIGMEVNGLTYIMHIEFENTKLVLMQKEAYLSITRG